MGGRTAGTFGDGDLVGRRTIETFADGDLVGGRIADTFGDGWWVQNIKYLNPLIYIS